MIWNLANSRKYAQIKNWPEFSFTQRLQGLWGFCKILREINGEM